MSAIQIFRDFVHAINAHDIEDLSRLMSANHLFIDSLGQKHRGRDTMREGWAAYFSMVPNYRIKVRHSFVQRSTIMAWGTASGGQTKRSDQWTVPAAWRATVKQRHISTWQVFADNEPLRARLRNGPGL